MTFTVGEMLRTCGLDYSKESERAVVIGLAMDLMARSRDLRDRDLSWHYQRIMQSLDLEQIEFYFDHYGRCCGHVWWTRLGASEIDEIIDSSEGYLGPHNLADFGSLWIIDLSARFGNLRDVLRALASRIPNDAPTATYLRVRSNKKIVKQIDLDDVVLDRFLSSKLPVESRPKWLLSDNGRSLLLHARSGLLRARDCGFIIDLFAKSSDHARMPVYQVLTRIRHAITARQYFLSITSNNVANFFYSWLWRESGGVCSLAPLHDLEVYEWSEGRHCFLGDAVARPEFTGAMFTHLHSSLGPGVLPYRWGEPTTAARFSAC